MRHFTTAVLERHASLAGDFATEPYETPWASEALFFIRAEETAGENPLLRARVQISADGIHWVDEGTAFPPITTTGDYFVRISHFGGWLRLAGTIQGEEGRFDVTIHLVLKE
ncbi:MAG TPA: hypothetical protein DD670_18410 [Planctomycetaceae bacterium]|nr:hypothetical protein [Planctomycetaceae bacterium]